MDIVKELINAFNEGYACGEAEIVHLKNELKTCRNELCLRCGNYKNSHLGACDGCRWKNGG